MCKYFLLGACAFGSNCFFLHESKKSNSSSSSSEISSTASSSASPQTSPLVDTTNSKLVTRVLNKPKLLTSLDHESAEQVAKSSKLSPDAPEFSGTHTESCHTYTSYYEALTGKKLPVSLNIDELDPDIFDENYVEYLKRRNEASASTASNAVSVICPYFEKSLECPFGANCEYTHGDVCDICNMACLSPFDEVQREAHKRACTESIERDMEEAFAVQRSAEKLCGICMEVVWEKENASDKRFGILENCNHIFCLPCIRKWRASKSYENKIVKACPECRVKSDFVTPSRFWFEDQESKKKIINEYKLTLK